MLKIKCLQIKDGVQYPIYIIVMLYVELADLCTEFTHLCGSFQGSTIRKRKMYEEFLGKVSILGKFIVQ